MGPKNSESRSREPRVRRQKSGVSHCRTGVYGIAVMDNTCYAMSKVFHLTHLDRKVIMAILKLAKANPRREMEFELDYLASLSTQQRFQMMFEKNRQMASLLRKDGRRKAPGIIKRA
jgi:tRNA pseudouridine-54 N-methylase